MSSANRPARLNRAVLGLLGLLVLLAGTGTVVVGLGLARRMLPGLDPTTRLTPPQVEVPSWSVWLTVAAAVVVGLGCLWWLLAQLRRRPRPETWALPAIGADPTGTTQLGSGDAAAAVATDISDYPEVRSVTADLTGRLEHPTLHLVVSTELDASAASIRDAIHGHALPRLRRALGAEAIATQLILQPHAPAPARTH